jgi:hypothetical protein
MTDHPTSFTTQELREVFDVLMRHVEERHGSTIDVGVDYFWSSPPDAINLSLFVRPQRIR